ncbi:MAG: sigma 54-interacting transcriptional regulator [Planctomycetaceae bacterium]|nr:sigma 54-interacting transcriptional regulator [Planctomycetaceae bacterium]
MPHRRPKRGLAVWITSTSLPVFVVDERRVVLMFNHGCEAFTGWSAADVVGQTCEYRAEVIPDDVSSLTGLLTPPQEVYAGRSCSRFLPLLHPDGSNRNCVAQFFPLGTTPGDARFRVLGVLIESAATSLNDAVPPPSWHTDLAEALRANQQRYTVALIGNSVRMQRTLARVALARESTVAVHVAGPPGSGREYIARHIHYGTPQGSRTLIPLDCRTGHAELQRVLERAFEFNEPEFHPGALCLKHVDALPRDLQVLVRNESRAPGSHPRLFSTTEVDLDQSVQAGEFDAELAGILTTLIVPLPALRDRPEDLPLLAQQILESFNARQQRQVEEFAPEVSQALARHDWPGNVAELERVIHDAWRRSTGSRIAMADLPWEYRAMLEAESVPPAPQFPKLEAHLEQVERTLIQRALHAANGSKTQAADWLGIPRAKLYRRMESLGIYNIEQDADAVPTQDES